MSKSLGVNGLILLDDDCQTGLSNNSGLFPVCLFDNNPLKGLSVKQRRTGSQSSAMKGYSFQRNKFFLSPARYGRPLLSSRLGPCGVLKISCRWLPILDPAWPGVAGLWAAAARPRRGSCSTGPTA